MDRCASSTSHLECWAPVWSAGQRSGADDRSSREGLNDTMSVECVACLFTLAHIGKRTAWSAQAVCGASSGRPQSTTPPRVSPGGKGVPFPDRLPPAASPWEALRLIGASPFSVWQPIYRGAPVHFSPLLSRRFYYRGSPLSLFLSLRIPPACRGLSGLHHSCYYGGP